MVLNGLHSYVGKGSVAAIYNSLISSTSRVSVTSHNQDVVFVASVPLTTEAWESFREGQVLYSDI